MRLESRFVRDAVWALLLLSALYFAVTAYSLRVEGSPQGGAQPKPAVTAANGLRTSTFDTAHGRVIVNLPDDMRAGDTISGTVMAEPKGQTEEERAQNLKTLGGYVVNLRPARALGQLRQTSPVYSNSSIKTVPVSASNGFTVMLPSHDGGGNSLGVALDPANAPTTPGTNIHDGGLTFIPLPQPVRLLDGTPSPNDFRLPTIGQQGRPVEIYGPFDGNTSNTTLRFGPAGSTVQDFEKRTENVSGGFGLVKPLAESPRKIVFESPSNLTGPAQIVLKEGDVETKGAYRNLGVRLSAPKTDLKRGERTTLTVEVSGLEGIKTDVPLQLDARGVINMDGGNFQNLRIKPTEVKPGGLYTTARAITGQQAGAFSCTATVIVRRFDICLGDDRHPGTAMLWNTFTGDYFFTNPGPTGQPSATGGLNLTGTGKPAMKGCIITLTHNAPDRRVFARLDVCNNTGSAEVQSNSPKATSNITDTNTADNACPASGQ